MHEKQADQEQSLPQLDAHGQLLPPDKSVDTERSVVRPQVGIMEPVTNLLFRTDKATRDFVSAVSATVQRAMTAAVLSAKLLYCMGPNRSQLCFQKRVARPQKRRPRDRSASIAASDRLQVAILSSPFRPLPSDHIT